MTTLEDLEKVLAAGKWKKAVKKADEILTGTPFEQGENRFSFMNRDSYCLYCMKNPDREPVWIKNHSNVAYCKGYALFEMKQYREAADTLLYCTLLDPVTVKIKNELFSCYVRLGKKDKAENVLRASYGDILSPEDARSLYAKTAYIYSDRGEYDTALSLCVYALSFGHSDSALREADYIGQKAGLYPEYLPGEDGFSSYAAGEGKKLTDSGIIPPFPRENLRVLRTLAGLYNAGNEPELSAEYADKIKIFGQVGIKEE